LLYRVFCVLIGSDCLYTCLRAGQLNVRFSLSMQLYQVLSKFLHPASKFSYFGGNVPSDQNTQKFCSEGFSKKTSILKSQSSQGKSISLTQHSPHFADGRVGAINLCWWATYCSWYWMFVSSPYLPIFVFTLMIVLNCNIALLSLFFFLWLKNISPKIYRVVGICICFTDSIWIRQLMLPVQWTKYILFKHRNQP